MACKALTILLLTVLVAGVVYGCIHSGESSKNRARRGLGVQTEEPSCDFNAKYRTYDGSCNNMNDTKVGRSGTLFSRALPPAYENNDGKTPRLSAKSGNPLPNGRKISRTIHDDRSPRFNTTGFTVIFPIWGQFLAHDITYTPFNTVKDGCCSNDLVTDNKQHPDVYTGGDCFPIIIDDADYWWTTTEQRCMEFYRSDSITDEDGVRQQYNQASSFIDGSHIYGLNENIAKNLRSFKDGKLKSKIVNGEEFPPEMEGADDSICYKIEPGDYCFAAGDDRANLFPGLSALHVMFLRYHNLIADRLKAYHSNYDDETLFQEARRIVVGVIQTISFNEFLPTLLGKQDANSYALTSSQSDPYVYHPEYSANLMNVFSTASYRMGHSMIPSELWLDKEVKIGDMFMRPNFVLKDLRGLVSALTTQHIDKIDAWYAVDMTNRLFEAPNKPKSGYDMVARNIQRGRDHGLPPYNDFRVRFGLPRQDRWNDFDNQADTKYPRVYESTADIDVYSGSLVEPDAKNGLSAKPFMERVMAEQFYYLKYGDRFWYENTDTSISGGAKLFTSQQAQQIGKVSLARVICDTVKGITKIQTDVMSATSNPRTSSKSCSKISDLDLRGF